LFSFSGDSGSSLKALASFGHREISHFWNKIRRQVIKLFSFSGVLVKTMIFFMVNFLSLNHTPAHFQRRGRMEVAYKSFPKGPRSILRSSSSRLNSFLSLSISSACFIKVIPMFSISSSMSDPASIRRIA